VVFVARGTSRLEDLAFDGAQGRGQTPTEPLRVSAQERYLSVKSAYARKGMNAFALKQGASRECAWRLRISGRKKNLFSE
jgi:hypothetical protein